MPLTLYMDQDSGDRVVVAALVAAGIDVLTSEGAGNRILSDGQQLEFARISGRVIYSANVGDFARLHATWLAAGRSHAGIVVRRKQAMPVGIQIRALLRLADTLVASDSTNMFEYLEAWASIPDH